MCLLTFKEGHDMQASKTSLLLLSGATARWLITAFTLLCTSTVFAGSIGVSPIRVDLSAEQRVGTITITNSSDQPKTIQLRLYQWQHQGQHTTLSDTKDLLAAPPMAIIPAQQTQIVRVGMRTQADATVEKSYRLMIEELPARQSSGVAIALKISIPVFVKPLVSAQSELTWRIETQANEHYLRVDNHGNGHAKIDHLRLLPALLEPSNAMSNIYVLPGAYYRWKLQPELTRHPALRLEATIHGKVVSLAVPVR